MTAKGTLRLGQRTDDDVTRVHMTEIKITYSHMYICMYNL